MTPSNAVFEGAVAQRVAASIPWSTRSAELAIITFA
jgi:hypothetical protein